MAFQVFFCDDDPEAASLYLPKIRFALNCYMENLCFTSFRSPQKLLTHICSGNACDLLITDIEMPVMSGIDLCRRLQEQGFSIPVIFLSRAEDRVFETFAFPTVYFLRKGRFDEELSKAAGLVLRSFSRKRETVLFSNGVQSYRLAVSDIRYAEIVDQTLFLHAGAGEISLRYKMDEAEKLLKPYGFLRIHKGYLVNCNRISSIQREELCLTDGTKLPVSRRRYRDIKNAFLRLTREEMQSRD